MTDYFLKSLEKTLETFKMSEKERIRIHTHYKDLIAQARDEGRSDDEILLMVGAPQKIIRSLELDYERKKRIPFTDPLIRLSPLFALAAYLYLGITAGVWHPTWLIFFLVPLFVMAIEMANDRDRHILTALLPLVSLLFFLWAGFAWQRWHPAWLVFLTVPAAAVINSRDAFKRTTLFYLVMVSLFSPAVFFLTGFLSGVHHPTWMILLLIPYFSFLQIGHRRLRYLACASLILSAAAYLALGYQLGYWESGLLIFLMVPLAMIMGRAKS